MEEQFFTIPEVAQIFRCTPDTARKKCRTGDWPSSKSGKQYLISESDIEQIKRIIRPTPQRVTTPRRGTARI